MSKYSGAETVASISFILFVISWILLRLTYYPFWVLWSTSYEVVLSVDKEKHTIDGPIYYYLFNTLLYCLLVLHIYWWVLMYRMLVKQIQARGQLSDDVRSGKLLLNPCFLFILFTNDQVFVDEFMTYFRIEHSMPFYLFLCELWLISCDEHL
ncbi:LAG1 longevity assurance-like protein 3 [Bienertia sinuspersici]